jgi:hypothetical protein
MSLSLLGLCMSRQLILHPLWASYGHITQFMAGVGFIPIVVGIEGGVNLSDSGI